MGDPFEERFGVVLLVVLLEELLVLLVLVGVRHLGDVRRPSVTYAATQAGKAGACRHPALAC